MKKAADRSANRSEHRRVPMRLMSALAAALVLFAALSSSACKGDDDYMPKPPPSQGGTGSPNTTAQQSGTAVPGETDAQSATASPAPDDVYKPYKGDGSEYVPIMRDPQYLELETDIAAFADAMLSPGKGHPKLVDGIVNVNQYNERSSYDSVKKNFFDPELRAAFIEKINDIILNLESLTQSDAQFKLMEAAAMLGDPGMIRETLFSMSEGRYPFCIEPLYDGDKVGLYVTAANDEKYLMRRIDSVNGVTADELLRLAGSLSCETDETSIRLGGLFKKAEGYNDAIFTPPGFMQQEELRYLGVVGEDGKAVFAFTLPDGSTVEEEIEPTGDVWNLTVYSVEGTEDADNSSALVYRDREFAWSRLSADGKTLYFRPNQCDFIGDVLTELEQTAADAHPERLVIDCRELIGFDNRRVATIIAALNRIEAEKGKFVLIDHTSDEAGTALAAMIKRFVDGALLVGTPTGSPTLIFDGNSQQAYASALYLQAIYGISATDYYPDNGDAVLKPDVTVYRSAEDHAKGIDSLLDAILNGELDGQN